MTDVTGSEEPPEPVAPSAPLSQVQRKSGGAIIPVVAVIVVVIVILAVLLIAFGGNDDDEVDNDGPLNGNGDKNSIKYITALGGKNAAAETANTWDVSAVLQHVRSFAGYPSKIDRDEWNWIAMYHIPTEKDPDIGDGRCMAWEYEYFAEDGDPFDRLHVLVFGNGTVIRWEERLSESVNSDTLSDWDLDSNKVTDMAKTLTLYENITRKDSIQKYVYYELRPYTWELNCDDGTDYIRIQIDERAKEIIYHYP